MQLQTQLILTVLAWTTLALAKPQSGSSTSIARASVTITLPTLWPVEGFHETEAVENASGTSSPDGSASISGEHSDTTSTFSPTTTELSLKLPDWTTSTTHAFASSTESAPLLAPSYTWNPFDSQCDNMTGKAEDCRATTECDASKHEYPVCRHGECVCRQVTCSTSSECSKARICREDDHDAVCQPEPDLPDVEGLCACEPRVVGCGSEANPHTFCSERLDCTINKRIFSLWSEFGQCTKREAAGECECQTVQCPFDNDGTKGDDFCKLRVTCPEEAEVACKIQWLAPPNDLGGYCTCAAGPHEPWDPDTNDTVERS